MNIPLNRLKSRADFETDIMYQSWCLGLFEQYRLRDGFAHTIDLTTGRVRVGKRMKLTEEKISKSP